MSTKIRVFGKTHNRTALGIINAYLIIYPQTTLEQMRVIFPNSINPVSSQKEMFVDISKESDPSKLDGYFTREEELLIMGDGKKVAMLSQWPLESLQRLIEKSKTYGIEVADFEPAEDALGCKGGYYIEFIDNWKPSGVVNQVLGFPSKAPTTPLETDVSVASAAAVAAANITASASPSNTVNAAVSTAQPSSEKSVPTDDYINTLHYNNSTSNETDTTMETMDNQSSNYDDSNLNWLWILIGLVVAGLFIWAICRSYQAQEGYNNVDGSEFLAQIQPGDATVEALPLEIPAAQAQDGTEVVDPEAKAAAQAQAEAAQAQEVDPQAYMARFVELQHQFNGIEYKNAKAVLTDSAKHVLNRVAALMEEYPSLDLRIEGHTSSVGRANYNQKLSQRRAEAVAQYLEAQGISAERLVAVGMGEAKPVDPANPNGSDNRVTCLFNITHNEARAQKESLADIVAKEVSEEGPITADF